MMDKPLRIGTRDSQLAVWQATLVQNLLQAQGIATELVYMKSEGDINLTTPLYEIGVTGVFTKVLDIALLENRIDLAVHSMKDVPTLLARGLQQAAVLERASYKDIFVYKNFAEINDWQLEDLSLSSPLEVGGIIATSSIRRMAQWKHRYPAHHIENLRGNVNTRLRKVQESHWQGAIFAAAGVERIGLRPKASIDLNWMLPAPAQGAIMVVCRNGDDKTFEACQPFHHKETAICVKAERDFLRTLMGGCSTPISALAEARNNEVFLRGNICSPDGRQKIEGEKKVALNAAQTIGSLLANELLNQPFVQQIMEQVRHGKIV